MFGRLSLILCLLVLSSCNPNNNAEFWSQKLGKNITFDAYSGFEFLDWYFEFGKGAIHYHLYSALGKTVKNGSDTPIFLWLQGGPGASSMFGAFT